MNGIYLSVSVVRDGDDSLRSISELGEGHDERDDDGQGHQAGGQRVDRQRLDEHLVSVFGSDVG